MTDLKTRRPAVGYIATGRIHQAVGGPIGKPMDVNAAERQIEFNGVKLSETKWAQRVGLPLSAVKTRIHRGWSIQDALTTPLHTAPSEILVPPGPSIAWLR